MNTADRLLLRGGTAVPLRPKVVDTLILLIEGHGRVLRKEELLRALWPDIFVEESNLTQNIYTLRKALGQDSRARASKKAAVATAISSTLASRPPGRAPVR